jgi:hypothetical protein
MYVLYPFYPLYLLLELCARSACPAAMLAWQAARVCAEAPPGVDVLAYRPSAALPLSRSPALRVGAHYATQCYVTRDVTPTGSGLIHGFLCWEPQLLSPTHLLPSLLGVR